MIVNDEQKKNIRLKGIHSQVEWQCAHAMVDHAEVGQRITVDFDTPEGELTLSVEPMGMEALEISKVKFPAANRPKKFRRKI